MRRMLNTKATFSSERPSEIASGHIDVCLGADFFESIPTTILGQWQKEPAETPSLISAATDVCEGDTCQVVTSASTSRSTARRVFFTGPVDQFFQSHGLPQLEYRSIRFEVVDLPSTPVFQPTVSAKTCYYFVWHPVACSFSSFARFVLDSYCLLHRARAFSLLLLVVLFVFAAGCKLPPGC